MKNMSATNSTESHNAIFSIMDECHEYVTAHNSNHFDIDTFNECVNRKLRDLFGHWTYFKMVKVHPLNEKGPLNSPGNLATSLIMMYANDRISLADLQRMTCAIDHETMVIGCDDLIYEFTPPTIHSQGMLKVFPVSVKTFNVGVMQLQMVYVDPI